MIHVIILSLKSQLPKTTFVQSVHTDCEDEEEEQQPKQKHKSADMQQTAAWSAPTSLQLIIQSQVQSFKQHMIHHEAGY